MIVHITEVEIVLCNANWHATECPDSRSERSQGCGLVQYILNVELSGPAGNVQYNEVSGGVRISGSPHFEVPLYIGLCSYKMTN